MKSRAGRKNVIRIFAFFLVFLLLFTIISEVLCITDLPTLANIKGFYLEPRNTIDVALVGPSEFYADYSAPMAWKKYGYTSYSLAVSGAPGSIYLSMLKEVEKRQNPKLVVFELNGFLQEDSYYRRRGQLHSWIDNIPWSANRVETIRDCIPKEEQGSFFFRFAAHHNNWKNIGKGLKCFWLKWNMTHTGFSYTKGLGTISKRDLKVKNEKPEKIQFSELSREYLTGLLDYCKKSGRKQVLFVRFPHGNRIKNPETMEQIKDLIESYGFDYLNLNESYEEIGIDSATDFYNPEHLNINGLLKMTDYFGRYLVEHYQIKDTYSEKQKAHWNECAQKTWEVLNQCIQDLENGISRRYSEISIYDLQLQQ